MATKIGAALAACLLMSAPAFAEGTDRMLDACRAYAAKHLHVSPDIVNVKYEGKRSDGTHAVSGDMESSPPMTFQCSFREDGKRIMRWWHDSPEGCPADISEANRYLYPDCN